MALTNNLKPSGFQPVGGGSLIYKWTESTLASKTNYRVVLQFNGYATLPDFEFRPGADLIIYADIATILRSLLAMDETVASRMINTYVKYQAVWDESSDAQVNLTGDVIYAYVGNNHDLNYRTKFDIAVGDGVSTSSTPTGVFLVDPTTFKVYNNRKTYIDFLSDGSLPSNCKFLVYDGSGNIVSNTVNLSVKGLYSYDFTTTQIGPYLDGNYLIWITNNAVTTLYAAITGTIEEECSEPVYIRWINDYGGLSHYMFEFNQVKNIQSYTRSKAKVLQVYENNLTMSQWDALNELLKEGQIYEDNYRVGCFVEDVTTYGSPKSLIVFPDAPGTETRKVKHQFNAVIRYPLASNILI